MVSKKEENRATVKEVLDSFLSEVPQTHEGWHFELSVSAAKDLVQELSKQHTPQFKDRLIVSMLTGTFKYRGLEVRIHCIPHLLNEVSAKLVLGMVPG